MKTKAKRKVSLVVIIILSLTGLCLATLAASFLVNAFTPQPETALDHLSELDKARLAEAYHLRQTLGSEVIPGWAEVDIPVIVYNQAYLFLVGFPEPADGWVKMPHGTRLGQPWELVPNDTFLGQPYYRQLYEQPDGHTQAFTVQVGDRWVASLSIYDWMKTVMTVQIQQDLPAVLSAVLPVSLFVDQLVPNSDTYIRLIAHESLHAYQGIKIPGQLNEAERINNVNGSSYPSQDEPFVAAWHTELDLLNQAMRAETTEEAAALARDFLIQRAARRENANLSQKLIELEQTREWEEGIAKYAELKISVLASETTSYTPLETMSQDKEFNTYRNAARAWDREIQQIRRMASDDGDGRFYYSGFAQAALLDRLSPGWKDQLFTEGVWLEDLLNLAIP